MFWIKIGFKNDFVTYLWADFRKPRIKAGKQFIQSERYLLSNCYELGTIQDIGNASEI